MSFREICLPGHLSHLTAVQLAEIDECGQPIPVQRLFSEHIGDTEIDLHRNDSDLDYRGGMIYPARIWDFEKQNSSNVYDLKYK